MAFGPGGDVVATGEDTRALLEVTASANLAPVARQRLLNTAQQHVKLALTDSVARFAAARAEVLADDHARVRAAGVNVSRVTVKPVVPPDVIGLFVLVPAEV